MKLIERACRAELAGLPGEVRSSALAKVAVDLARRLDAGPGDRDATDLSRELRQVLARLHSLVGVDVGGEVERFLEQVSNPAFRGPSH